MNHFPAKYKAKGDRGTKLAAVKVTTTVPLWTTKDPLFLEYSWHYSDRFDNW
jgi:hypothetical protein